MTFQRRAANSWIPATELTHHDVDETRCTREHLSTVLAHLPGVIVVAADINRTGHTTVPANADFGLPESRVHDLPEFCDVTIHQQNPGGHLAVVRVWVPLAWNGRFLGTGGGGNRLTLPLGIPGHEVYRGASLITALRNGFATANTDGGYGSDARFADWQLNPKSRELDAELIENWAHRSTHEMTVIGKAVTAAIHGQQPQYSYFQGCSGGGRQGLATAIYHPGDYDGVWSDVPAINWTRFIPSMGWASVVMNELANPLAPAKLEAFRLAAIADFNTQHGGTKPYVTSLDTHPYDPAELIGTATEAGPITERDAEVMRMIWEGPRNSAGEQLWFGLRPGAESWGKNPAAIGACATGFNNDGELEAEMGLIPESWFKTWLLQDPDWDWKQLTIDEFVRLFELGIEKFAHISMDNPDLSEFCTAGGKILFTQGLDDEVVFPEGLQQYYDRVVEHMGGFDKTAQFARLFFCPGDGHGATTNHGPGLDLATGMAALMAWVENDAPPETLDTRKFAGNGVQVDHLTATLYRRR